LTTADCAPITTGNLTFTTEVVSGECRITFKSGSGTWMSPSSLTTVKALLVGGGGGGGAYRAGGGGGGAVIENLSLNISAGTSYPLVVGAGGNGARFIYYSPAFREAFPATLSGATTGFGITAGGGGNGASAGGSEGLGSAPFMAGAGVSGSSGGGASGWSAVGAGSSPGSRGGIGLGESIYANPSGGGGGAGGLGNSATTNAGARQGTSGWGGIGLKSTLTGLFYGGGGGGACSGTPIASYFCLNGLASTGGGGSGRSTTGDNGTPNTGGGGGGGGSQTSNSTGGNGGSGVIVIQYAIPNCSVTGVSSGGYTRYTFTGIGLCNWTVPAGVSAVDLLLVAGGGAGGGGIGGGGGAGEMVETSAFNLTAGEKILVAIGAGGANQSWGLGSPGQNSTFSTLTAHGGGGGGVENNPPDKIFPPSNSQSNFGSGGGGGYNNTSGDLKAVDSRTLTSPTVAFRNQGGVGSGSGGNQGGGGGGGGAGGAGSAGNASTQSGGAGGLGRSSDISGTSTFYAGGGGGGLNGSSFGNSTSMSGGTPGSGGSGVGGNGGAKDNTQGNTSNPCSYGGQADSTNGCGGEPGLANTGSGGGGASNAQFGGPGGSGIVIARTGNPYSITYKSGTNGTGADVVQAFIFGTNPKLGGAATALYRPGYTISGWSDTNGGAKTHDLGATYATAANLILYPVWNPNTYVVTYDATTNGGTAISPLTDTATVGSAALTLATPVARAGYTASGWFTAASGGTKIGDANATGYSPPSDIKLFFQWTPTVYSLTYVGNGNTGGSVPTDSTEYNIGNSFVVAGNTNTLVRTGYTFNGWTDNVSETGTVYTSGVGYTVGSSNISFRAKWSANTYTITYNSNGASGSAQRSSSNVTSDSYTSGGTAITLPTVGTLVKTGYTFAGWSTTTTGSAVADGYTTASDVTLYAVWNVRSITVTYSSGTIGSDTATATVPVNATGNFNTSITLGAPSGDVVISGNTYKFSAWLVVGGSLTYQAGATYLLPAADVTLEAKWVQVLEVKYILNGGTLAAGDFDYDGQCVAGTRLCTINQSIAANAAPSRTGYTFAGWKPQVGAAIDAGATFAVTNDSYILTAQWTALPYTITYDSVGGATTPTEGTKQISQSFTVANAPIKAGYTFNGWNDTVRTYGSGALYIVGSSNVTLTAQWTANVYTVTYDWNGGTGSATASDSYTVATSAYTLPTQSGHTKDGFNFGGWSTTSNGSDVGLTYAPTQSLTLFARWTPGNFTLTYNANGGSVSSASVSVANGTAAVLLSATRSNYVLDGWFTAANGGTRIGAAGASFTPTRSRTLFAQWTQLSLAGIAPAALTRLGSLTASSTVPVSYSVVNNISSVSVTVPAGSLAQGTVVNLDLVGNFTRPSTLLSPTNSYIISVVVSWAASDGTVQDTANDKPITMVISNSTIKRGMSIYGFAGSAYELLGTAIVDGSVTLQITKDPEIVVAATKPAAPTSLTVTAGIRQAVLSWSAPTSNGGSAITGYTVNGTNGATCTTTNTSCTITGLTNATAHTFSVSATNAIGVSVLSDTATATTFALPGAPTSVTASDDGEKESVVSWTAPAFTDGFDILSYTVTANGVAVCTVDIAICAVTGLVDGTNYSIAVFATTSVGNGVPSSSASIRTSGTAPVVNTGGGGSAAPVAPVEPVAPVVPVAPKPNITVVSPVTVVSDQGVKTGTIDIATSATGANTNQATIKVDAANEKVVTNLKVVDNKLVVTVDPTFSGFRTVSVTITENGVDRVIQIPLTVLPEAVTSLVVTPMTATRSVIRWNPSPNATSYTAYLGTKRLCSTAATSCIINRILGPGSVVTVVSNGGDRTLSQKVQAQFNQSVSIQVVRIVSATITKSALTAVDTKALDKIVALIKNQGFRTVQISEIITTRKTKNLADSRIADIKKYISSQIGTIQVKFEVTPAKSKTYFNYISVKG
jgi:uncharacterized repeat protein (TIGR02543 family)